MKTILRIFAGAVVGLSLGCGLFFIGWIVMYARYADGPRFSQRDAGMALGFIAIFGGAITCVGAAVVGMIAAFAGRILLGAILGLVAALIVVAYSVAEFGNEPVVLIPAAATAVSWFVTGIAAAVIGKTMKANINRPTSVA